MLLLPMHVRRDFQAQGVEPDEAGGVVLVVGFGRVGFHRGNHSRTGAEFTQFSFVWLSAYLPARRENQSAASALRATVAAREFP
jgi:hypothetical protein